MNAYVLHELAVVAAAAGAAAGTSSILCVVLFRSLTLSRSLFVHTTHKNYLFLFFFVTLYVCLVL